MEERTEENATNNNINSQADNLSDLPVPDEQADETKAGDYGVWRSRFGSTL